MSNAKRVFISYAHEKDNPAHAQRVRGLADSLIRDGVECRIDQYLLGAPPEGWLLWMEKSIEWADYVLVVCTPTYLRRVRKEEEPGKGHGATWEANLIYIDVYESHVKNSKYFPVVFDEHQKEFIPKPLRGGTHYLLDGQSGYDNLYRRITGQPRFAQPPLGQARTLPTAESQPLFAPTGSETAPKPRDNFLDAGIAPNRNFLGRDEELAQLHSELQTGNVALIHALTGEGGIGKTELAKAYALSHEADYDGRWWLDASNEAIDGATFKLVETVSATKVDPQTPPEQIRLALCRALSGGRNLLILDNLENALLLEQFVVKEPARILVTTRQRDLPAARVKSVEVEVLKPDAAVDLLCKDRTDLSSKQHREALGKVADFLGCHTFSIALAAEYLRMHKNVSPSELLDRLKQAELGAKDFPLEEVEPNKLGTKYRKSLAASLGLHLPTFEKTPAMNILNAVAFCHPANIPIDLLRDASGLSQQKAEEWLIKLAGVSILDYERTVSVHRLMQSLLRSRLKPKLRSGVLNRLISALRPHFADALDHRNWPHQDDYAAHAQSVVEYAAKDASVEDAGALANQLGLYLRGRLRFTEAETVYRHALAIDEQSYGPEHPNVAIRLSNLAQLLQATNRLADAEPLMRRALKIDEQSYGPEHPEVATDLNNLAALLKATNRLADAEPLMRRALAIDEQSYGPDHPKVAIDLNNLALLLQATNRLADAEPLMRRAIEIRCDFGRKTGHEHPKMQAALRSYRGLLKAMKLSDEEIAARLRELAP